MDEARGMEDLVRTEKGPVPGEEPAAAGEGEFSDVARPAAGPTRAGHIDDAQVEEGDHQMLLWTKQRVTAARSDAHRRRRDDSIVG